MDIGTLTGEIELEDKVSDTLTLIGEKVTRFAERFEGALGVVALGAGALVAAVGTATAAVVALGNKGSELNGVETAFDRLARAAGSTGEELSGSLNEGLKGTVDGMAQMQAVMRPLIAGVKLTADDMKVMGQVAREVGKATGTDATQGLETLSSALTTGRTRGLAMAGIVVDVSKAEAAFAKSLGITADQLNEAGKLEARRIGILQALRDKVDQLGVSELSFKERIEQAQVTFGNWFDDLAKAIDKSPSITRAWDEIGGALQRAFGGTSQRVLESVVYWVNKFADAAAYYGPRIIDTISYIKRWIEEIWHAVQNAWDLVPDWFKHIAAEATLAGGAVYLVSRGFKAAGGPDVINTIASFATITSGLSDLTKAGLASIPIIRNIGSAIQNLSFMEVVAVGFTAIRGAIAGFMTGAGGAAIYLTGLVFAAYRLSQAIETLYNMWKRGEPMWNFFGKGGGFWDNSIIGRWLGMSKSVDAATDALAKNREELERLMKTRSVPGSGLPSTTGSSKGNEDYIKALDLDKVKAATEKSIHQTAALWDEYFGQIDKLTGDTLSTQFNAIDRWHAKEKSELDASKKLNQNYYNELSALSVTYNQKRATAEILFFRSQADEVQKFNLNVIDKLPQVPLFSRQTVSALGTLPAGLNKAADAARNLGKALKEGVLNTLTQIPQVIISSLTGGGGVAGALQGVGSLVGSQFGKIIGASFKTLGKFGGPLGEAIGSLAGPLLSMLANIGGPSARELAGRDVVKQFEEQQGGWQGIQRALLATGMAADQVNAKIEAMWRAEKLGAEASKAVIADITSALDAYKQKQEDIKTGIDDVVQAGRDFGRRLPADIRLSVKALMEMKDMTDEGRKALQELLDQGPNFADVQDRASKFGITLAGLGKNFQQSDIEGRSKELTDLFEDIETLGGDIGGALSEARDKFSQLAQDSLKYKVAIPENMRPYLQELARSNQLVDENGDAIKDLTGLTFEATPLDTSMDKLTKAIQHLSDIFEGIPGKIDKIGDAAGRLPDDPFAGWTNPVTPQVEPIYAARGFVGRVSKATRIVAGEAGTEDVFIGPPGSLGGGGGTTTIGDVYLNVNIPEGTNMNDPKEFAKTMYVVLRQDTGLMRTAIEDIAKRQVQAA